jgi:hypothetical protein
MINHRMLWLVSATLLLAACGGAADTADSTNTADREAAGRRGVHVCVDNATARDIRVEWLLPERPGLTRLHPGASTCDGGSYDFRPADVSLVIKWDDNLTSQFSFNNPNVGEPTVTQDPGQSAAADACGIGDIDIGDWGGLGFSSDCFDNFSEGEAVTYADKTSYHGLVITRRTDSPGDKEFTISVRQ